ncbi:protein kinase family protein [Oerskovia flava]|uniref:protein kinase family protein n=1 Tax=Oerskovia flava TaxID=2986422 RepID=UPI00223F4C9A|nr:protein kinase family protein [Oerskovia sp. JB1-3-2]
MNDVGPGALLVARYRLAEQLTSDLAGMTAWSAHDQILDRPVRITLLSGPYVADALDSARRAALVTDPRLTRVLDVGSENGLAYVVTEPFTGLTLSDIVASGIVDPQQARAVIGEAAAALEVARRRGVHHLALRPDAVRVDGSRVVVTGLGTDAGVSGQDQQDPQTTSRTDAVALVALLYYTMTARWAGPSLDVPWISEDAIHPLPAQRDEQGVMPLAALVRDVPQDLSTLCEQTFANAGPQSPGDVVAALEPWGEVSVVAALPAFVQAQNPTDPVNRQSVLTMLGTGAAAPPGTPPPAPPVRRPSTGRIQRAPEAFPGGAGAVPPPPPEATAAYPAAAYPPPDATQGMPQGAPPPGPPEAPAGGPRKPGKFNPTALVLLLVLVGVVIGVVWAIGNVVRGFEPPLQAGERPVITATEEAEEPDGETAEPAPTAEPTQDVRPQIAGGRALDPEGDAASESNDGEHPEAVELAFDGQPETFWYTRTYNSAQFGGLKSAVGYAIILEEAAPVSSIVLDTNSEGGQVEVRATTEDAPTEGEVLASGAFSSTTELIFDEPVEGESFVLWITELPQTSDGRNRLELNEIEIS